MKLLLALLAVAVAATASATGDAGPGEKAGPASCKAASGSPFLDACADTYCPAQVDPARSKDSKTQSTDEPYARCVQCFEERCDGEGADSPFCPQGTSRLQAFRPRPHLMPCHAP